MAPIPGSTSTEVFPRRRPRGVRHAVALLVCHAGTAQQRHSFVTPSPQNRSAPTHSTAISGHHHKLRKFTHGNTATIPRGSRLTHSLGTSASEPGNSFHGDFHRDDGTPRSHRRGIGTHRDALSAGAGNPEPRSPIRRGSAQL